MNSRQRPLHTCGVSLLAVCDLACNRTQDHLNGPLGSSLRRVMKSACPLIYAMQYQWLAILSFVDDHILTVEKMIEKLFPPSAYVFDKTDQLVRMIETVPEKLDDTVNRFPAIVHKVPLIEWALVNLISWLNCLISTLNRWGSENSRIKEITVDVDVDVDVDMKLCSEELQGSASEGYHRFESDNGSTESAQVVMPYEPRRSKVTFKDVLEGEKEKEEKSENNENKKGEKEREWQSQKNDIDEDEDEGDGSIKEEDPILQLFDYGWLMNPVT
ncbi:hypothetical protein L6164_015107 [Bauhinia variegata]|uniref:Uncharacterized protein n=1 Tax=Bauhinia variegata TaxID=167791 RepID=A0ACB9NJ91_BAUVA|nr:hypothetical protein L6164_015107 [Bauhinia variegata]